MVRSRKLFLQNEVFYETEWRGKTTQSLLRATGIRSITDQLTIYLRLHGYAVTFIISHHQPHLCQQQKWRIWFRNIFCPKLPAARVDYSMTHICIWR